MKCINHPETDAVASCNKCGKHICSVCKVQLIAETYCKDCIAEKTAANIKQKKSPILAAILSLSLAGLGQAYNGEVGKGLLIFFTSWLIIPWIYSVIDAYKTANKINEGAVTITAKPGCITATIIFMVITPFIIIMLAISAAIIVPVLLKAKELKNGRAIEAPGQYPGDLSQS